MANREGQQQVIPPIMIDALTENELLQIPENVRLKLHKLQEQVSEFQLKFNIVAHEKDELIFVLNKRNEEVDRLADTVKTMSDQLQSCTVSKIDSLVKVDELTGKELELEYREKQLYREKEWMAKQVEVLTDELQQKQSEIIKMQREFNMKHLQLSNEILERDRQIRNAELSLENFKKANDTQERQIRHLIAKLKEAEDIETKLQENHRHELTAQCRIAALYKESSEEACKKVEELQVAVSNLQDLLKNATTKYGDLETKFINSCKYYQIKDARRDGEISKIKKELENANKLINTLESKDLTNELMQNMSPAAAAATCILRSTKSFTQIYSEYHTLLNEVMLKKKETDNLNEMVKELLQEIKRQGPELESEKLKNQHNLQRLEILQNQLDLALYENEKASQVTKKLNAMERENSRLRAHLSDLAMQVRVLLKEIELQRGDSRIITSHGHLASNGVEQVPNMEALSKKVIPDNLITFKNIKELQTQNQRLLAMIKELTERNPEGA